MSRAILDPASRDEILRKFKSLSASQMKSANRMALQKSGKVLSDKAKYYLRTATNAYNHKNWWNGKSLQSGIKVSVNRDVTNAAIHILGDFRLKFFQDGTKVRYTKGKRTAGMRKNRIKTRRKYGRDVRRGSIRGSDFFGKAQRAVGSNIESTLNNCLNQSIKKVWERG